MGHGNFRKPKHDWGGEKSANQNKYSVTSGADTHLFLGILSHRNRGIEMKTKTITVSVELNVPENISREQISDEIMTALKKYKPFIEDVGD